MKRTLAIVLALVLLGGCAIAANAQEQFTLRYCWWGGDARHEATLAAIALYEELNPHVKIEAEYQGYDGYNDKLLTQLAGGMQPNVMQIMATGPAEYFSTFPGAFVKLDEQDIFDISGFDQGFLNSFGTTVDGSICAVPTGVSSYNFVVNRTVFERAGIELPESMTWDECLELGKALHAANPDFYLFSNGDDDWNHFLRSYVRQLTGRWTIEKDWSVVDDRDALIEAFTWLQASYTENVAEPMESAFVYFSDRDANKKWLNNEIAFSYRASSAIALIDTSGGMELDVVNIPIVPGAEFTGVITQPAQCLMVAQNADTEEALKFVNWLFNDMNAGRILKDVRGMPPVGPVRDTLAAEGLLNPIVSKAVGIALEVTDGPVFPGNENTEVYGFLHPLMEELCYGAVTPEEAADRIINELPEIVEGIRP